MAYDRTKMNNIGGSMGLSNLWIYSEGATAIATLDADNYFATATSDGVRQGDLCFIKGSDGVCFGYFEVLTATTSQLTALTDVAH